MQTLFDLARDNLTTDELEEILRIKKAKSIPQELTEDEKLHQYFVRELTKGPNPHLYAP